MFSRLSTPPVFPGCPVAGQHRQYASIVPTIAFWLQVAVMVKDTHIPQNLIHLNWILSIHFGETLETLFWGPSVNIANDNNTVRCIRILITQYPLFWTGVQSAVDTTYYMGTDWQTGQPGKSLLTDYHTVPLVVKVVVSMAWMLQICISIIW